MTSETDYRMKMRAVFLAAIMVISMVGMSVAFAGAAAANNLDESVDAYSNDNPYQGQDVIMNQSGELVDANISDDEEYDLRQVDEFDGGTVESSSSVRDVFAGEDGADDDEILIETDDLDTGDYFVTGGELADSNDVFQNNTFEVRIQSIDTYEFDDDEVTDEGRDATTELEIDSNRGSSNFVIDAGDGDLDNEELASIHVSDANIDRDNINITAGEDGGQIVMSDEPDGNITADDYVDILRIIEEEGAGVQFEDDDVTEQVNPLYNKSTELNASVTDDVPDEIVIESDELSDYDGSPFEISGDNEVENITSPNDQFEINPFNALLIDSAQDEEDDPDDRVVLLELRDTDEDVDFTGIDDGDYTFDLNVADTEASASADITVNEEDQDADFSQGTYQAGAGDIAEFEFELEDTDEAFVQIGDADSDFADFLYVEVDDSDEPFEVAVNTRLLGANGTQVDEDAVYDVENDEEFASLLHPDDDNRDTNFDTRDDAFFDEYEYDGTEGLAIFADDDDLYQPGDIGEFYDDLDLVDDDELDDDHSAEDIREEMLTRPLQDIDYELQIASDAIDEDDEGVFDSDEGAGEATDQLDAAVLELQAASIGDINTWTAFEEDADDEDDVEELLDIVAERDEIAYEDRLVVQVEATGLYGGLVAAGSDDDTYDPDESDFDRLEDGLSTQVAYDFFDEEQINFDIESETATGQDPLEVDLENDDDDDTYMLIGPDQDQFFLIVDTGSDSAFSNGDAPEDGDSFTAEFEYDADNQDDRFEFGNTPFDSVEDANNYPYLSQGDVLSASAEFDIEPREISFDNLNEDDEIQAENIEDSEISGETNVAPGSDAELRVSSTDASSSFREGMDVDINEDGEIAAEYDFSDQEAGDEFDTRFRAEGSTVDTVDSVIVEEGDLGVEDPVEDDEDDDVVDDDDDVVDDDDDVVDDEEDDLDDDVEDVDDETPGFGAIVALVALIGAALLAVRRQN